MDGSSSLRVWENRLRRLCRIGVHEAPKERVLGGLGHVARAHAGVYKETPTRIAVMRHADLSCTVVVTSALSGSIVQEPATAPAAAGEKRNHPTQGDTHTNAIGDR
eukprot:scaffold5314_cov64-Phaeocystis_antarctica.AAC.4